MVNVVDEVSVYEEGDRLRVLRVATKNDSENLEKREESIPP